MKRLFLYIFLLSVLFSPALGQEKPTVYFEANDKTLAPGSEISVDVFLTSAAAINVIDLEINYSNLEFLNFNDANSIIDIWQNKPKTSTSGVIQLEGGLTQPFTGQAGEIIKLNLRLPHPGLAQLSFNKADVYLANGLGTKVQSQTSPLSISVISGAPLKTLNQPKDTTPPTLNVEVAENPIEKSNLVIFDTRDRESGIKANYFREVSWFFWSDWQTVNSPLQLPTNAWAFQIKTLDNQNNAATQTVYVKEEIIRKIIYLVVLIAAVLAVFYFFKIRRTRKKARSML
jgi:hypothetical protein